MKEQIGFELSELRQKTQWRPDRPCLLESIYCVQRKHEILEIIVNRRLRLVGRHDVYFPATAFVPGVLVEIETQYSGANPDAPERDDLIVEFTTITATEAVALLAKVGT